MPKTFAQEGHTEKILHKLWKQCENNEFCDVVLIAGSKENRISAHRNVLSAASDYFARMFASPMRESVSGKVEMPTADGGVLQQLVKYCYIGSVEISEDIAVELLETADMLLLNNVVAACENFLVEQLDSSNCFAFVHLAERYNCEMLLQKADEYILENLMEIYGTDEFLNLNMEQLCRLLRNDELCVSEKEHVFHSVKAWIQYDPSERTKHKVTLLKFVRMPLLKLSFLMEHVNTFCDSTDCHKLYVDALNVQSSLCDGFLDESKLIKPRRLKSILMAITKCLTNEEIYLYYFCSKRHKWMEWLSGLEYRSDFGFAVMEDDIFIVGGRDVMGDYLNTVSCLNLTTLTLKPVAAMHIKRYCCNAVALNGFLYAVGGCHESSVEKWNPKANKWDFVASMLVERANFNIAVLNGQLYAVGGDGDNNYLRSAERYDPVQNVWQSIAPMNEEHQFPGVAVVNGLLYVVGGITTTTVERYDPKTNMWTTVCSLRQELDFDDSCTTFRDKVTLCYADRVEQYDARTNKWKSIDSLDGLCSTYLFSISHKLLTDV